MKTLKKRIAFVMALTLAVTTFTACGSKPAAETAPTEAAPTEGEAEPGAASEETPQAEATGNPVTLKTVSMHGGTDPNAKNYQNVNAAFMDQYSYITIQDDSSTSTQEWKTKVAADFAVGNEPDVIQYFTDANASDVLEADKFVTYDEIKAAYPDYAKDTLPDALETVTNLDGVKRAVPTTGYWEGLFCNKDLFDKYSVEIPTDWASFLKAVETFKANDVIPVAVSLNEVPHYWVENLLMGMAGKAGYEAVPTADAVPQEWVAALNMIKTLKDMGAFPKDTDTIDNAFAEQLFKDKNAAMIVNGSWFVGGIPDQENTVVTAFPTPEGGKVQPGEIIGGISNGFYITKKAWEDPDKRDAAVKFVMAHTNKDSVQTYWNGNGRAATEVTEPEGLSNCAKSGVEYNAATASYSSPTDARFTQEAYNTLIKGIPAVAAGTKTAEDLLTEVLTINAK